MPATPVREVQTARGVARLHVDGDLGGGLLVLGHGAGGGVEATDLLAARDAGLAAGLSVVRVEQPWRVRGRRVAEPPAQLDAAWLAAGAWLRAAGPAGRPLVAGGRSAGARVACRTATALGATAVLCLAFPLVPPGRPERTRASELALPGVPLLVVQGSRDAFGVPTGAAVIEGADHAFAVRRGDPAAAPQIESLVRTWLLQLP